MPVLISIKYGQIFLSSCVDLEDIAVKKDF